MARANYSKRTRPPVGDEDLQNRDIRRRVSEKRCGIGVRTPNTSEPNGIVFYTFTA